MPPPTRSVSEERRLCNEERVRACKLSKQALVEELLNRQRSKQDSIITDLFYGIYLSCFYSTDPSPHLSYHVAQSFSFLTLPIPSGGSPSLDDCFQKYLAPYLAEQSPGLQCGTCGKEHDRHLYTKFWKLPKILILHLKQYQAGAHFVERKEVQVDCPLEWLDLSAYVTDNPQHKPAVYDLLAVNEQFGSMRSGHYIAKVKDPDTGQWRKFNDSSVSSIQPAEVVTENAMVLYYRLRD